MLSHDLLHDGWCLIEQLFCSRALLGGLGVGQRGLIILRSLLHHTEWILEIILISFPQFTNLASLYWYSRSCVLAMQCIQALLSVCTFWKFSILYIITHSRRKEVDLYLYLKRREEWLFSGINPQDFRR